MPELLSIDLWLNAPLVALLLTALVVLLLHGMKGNLALLTFRTSLAGIALAAILTAASFSPDDTTFNRMIQHSAFGSFFTLLFLAAAAMTLVLSKDYLDRMDYHPPEFYVLVIFTTIGMVLMATGLDLIVIFLGIELMSVALYVLVGLMRRKEKANESSLKYFLLGAFMTGFLLYGIALVYGATGSTSLEVIRAALPHVSRNPLFIIGVGFLVVAFSFKVAAVPFHMWAPDVYEGAPTTVTGFMSTGAKAAAFAVFLTVLVRALEFAGTTASEIVAYIAAASMIVGNVTAIAQVNLKRLLAYSSIAHAGYILTGVAAGSPEGESGVLYYLAAYTLMNIGAFGIISWMEQQDDTKLTFDDYNGLSDRRPAIAASMSIFMFSLAGIPPFAGFFGKYYVFLAAVKADMTWLAIIGVLTSLISVYYYLRVVVVMYFRKGESDIEGALPIPAVTTVGLAAFLTIAIGVYPSLVLSLAREFFKI